MFAAQHLAAKLIKVLVKDKKLDPMYAEYLFTNRTKMLDLAKPSYDCVEDDSALLQIASVQSPVNSSFSIISLWKNMKYERKSGNTR